MPVGHKMKTHKSQFKHMGSAKTADNGLGAASGRQQPKHREWKSCKKGSTPQRRRSSGCATIIRPRQPSWAKCCDDKRLKPMAVDTPASEQPQVPQNPPESEATQRNFERRPPRARGFTGEGTQTKQKQGLSASFPRFFARETLARVEEGVGWM